MNIKKEFNNFAILDRKIKQESINRYSDSINPTIIEERNMNITSIDVFSRLLMDRIIFLGTEIDDDTANIVQAQLLFLESVDKKKDISIYINSPGGSVYSGLGIYDTMQLISPDIVTICTGLAASISAILLCAGTKGKRSSLVHSKIMIHQPILGGLDGQASDIVIAAKEIDKCKKTLVDIISLHSGQDPEKVFSDVDRDYWLSSQEAKDYGLIDNILIKR